MLDGPFRVGPWPGLSPRGGAVLVGCALLLGIASAATGDPRRALPDVPLLSIASLLPMLLATRLVNAPGAASGVCGAYLLPRSLISLIDPAIDPPPLLLVSAVAFDLVLWLRAADLARVASAWPRRDATWRKHPPKPIRQITLWRALCAGAAFGIVLSLVEPPFSVLLGADPSHWTNTDVATAGGVTAVCCALLAAVGLSGRGRAS
jgi:hypothetical protein